MNDRADRIHQALRNPADAFGTPEAIEREPALSRAEKLVVLSIWENDARELAVAEEENMGGGEPDLLVEVAAARARLETEGTAAGTTSSAHKHASPVPDPGVFRVCHFMRAPGATAHPDHGLDEAVVRLDAAESGVLPVCDGDQIVGVLSRRDLEAGAAATETAPHPVTARHVMTTDVAFCFPDDEARTARAMMDRHACDHLLVLGQDKALAGILERRDLPPAVSAPASAQETSAHGRESSTDGVSSTIQPGGLDVYTDRPKVKGASGRS